MRNYRIRLLSYIFTRADFAFTCQIIKHLTFLPLSSDIQSPTQLRLNVTHCNSVFMHYPALHVRCMFLLQFKYNCQLLRHVQGFPLLGLIWADLTGRRSASKGSSFALLLAKLPYHYPCGTPLDLSSYQCISSYMPRLNNPADSPQPNQNSCFAWTSMALQTSSVSSNIYRSDTSTSGSRQSLWPI